MWFQFFIVTFTISLLAFSLTDVLMSKTLEKKVTEKAVESITHIATTFAEIPDVKKNIDRLGGGKVIQPLANSVREKTGVEFLVTYSLEALKTLAIPTSSSPPNREGTFAGEIHKVLQGRKITLYSESAEDATLKSTVPAFRDGRLVGAVSVGIYLRDLDKTLFPIYQNMVQALLWGVFFAFSGVMFITWNLKRIFKGKEPEEIFLLFSEWNSLLDSVHEGIIAIDDKGVVKLINESGKKILGKDFECHVGTIIENSRSFQGLAEVLKTGLPLNNVRVKNKSSVLIMNAAPVHIKNHVRGAIISFRDMTELLSMAEQVTGTKIYAEALRTQNHEYKNKLHAIVGMLRLNQPEEALRYICHVNQVRAGMDGFVTDTIKSFALAGIILGKITYCRENGISFKIDENSYCGPLEDIDDYVLTVVMGNLLENAIEAVASLEKERRHICISIFDESDCVIISVKDKGRGIEKEHLEKIFEKGFTTKNKGNHPERGYGLSNIYNAVVGEYGGEIDVESTSGKGTQIIVNIPKRPRS